MASAGLTPTHLGWHCLADGGRRDIFDLTLALAREHGLAMRAWLSPGRHKLRRQGLPAVDHEFLDSFRLDIDNKPARYAALLHDLPPGLTEWAVHPGLGNKQSQALDLEHVAEFGDRAVPTILAIRARKRVRRG